MEQIEKKVNNDKTGDSSAWIIKNDKDNKFVDYYNTFKELRVYQPAKNQL